MKHILLLVVLEGGLRDQCGGPSSLVMGSILGRNLV